MSLATTCLARPKKIEITSEERARRAMHARATSGRRRNVDPTTCDRDYSKAELEFSAAIQAYKISSGRMFPTWSEVLEVLTDLGYQKSVRTANLEPKE